MILQGRSKYPVREVILHCAAINTGQFAHMAPFQAFATVNQWHRERGFSGFGYHGLFMPDGSFYPGRPYIQIGAHCLERNRGSIGFLLIETRKIEKVSLFEDYFTPQQARSLRAKIAEIEGIARVSGHNDYAQRLCPGFDVRSSDWL